MTNRSKHLPYYVTIIGFLFISIGFNIILFEKLNKLITVINTIDSPISKNDLQKIMKEISELSDKKYTSDSNIRYDIRTKQPMKNNF